MSEPRTTSVPNSERSPMLPSSLTSLAIVALFYYAAARIGLWFAIPPGFATAVWIPSGVALAAMLILHRGRWWNVWPGVFVGSFTTNLWIATASGASHAPGTQVLLAGVIASGAALQAWIGASLVRRFVGYPSPLQTTREVALFLALGGPIACLTNATISVFMLRAAGVVPPDVELFTWWTWWLGDTIGVLGATPVALIFLGRPRAAWRARAIPVGIPLLLTGCVVVAVFVGVRASERRHIRQEVESRTVALAQIFTRYQQDFVEQLRSVRSLYASSDRVERDEFRTFLAEYLDRHSEVFAISWVPRVASEDRARFEQARRRDGNAEFMIREIGPAGEIVPAGDREDYFPVAYFEPGSRAGAALGLDLACEPVRAAALRHALESPEPTASQSITLVQDRDRQRACIVLAPFFSPGAPIRTLEQRRAALVGYVSGVVRVGDLLSKAISVWGQAELDVRLLDGSGPNDRTLAANELLIGPPDPDSTFAVGAARVPIGGRAWRLEVRPTPRWLALNRRWEAYGVLAGGCFLMSLLGVTLLIATGRTAVVEGIVTQRTAALRESEQRFERAVHGSSAGIWDWNVLTGEDYLSPRWKQLLGYADHELPNTVESFRTLLHPDDAPRVWDAVQAHFRQRIPYDAEFRMRSKSGEVRWVHARGQAVWDEQGRPIRMSGSLIDIQDRKLVQERLQEETEQRLRAAEQLEQANIELSLASRTDPLTQAYNRRAWCEAIEAEHERAIRFGHCYAVVMLDADHFKRLNDSLGHLAGDACLQAMVRAMKSVSRDIDIVGRYGGEEFVILCPCSAENGAATLAERIRLAILDQRIHHPNSGPRGIATVSIGVAAYRPGDHWQAVVDRADQALYRAKREGRNRVCASVSEVAA